MSYETSREVGERLAEVLLEDQRISDQFSARIWRNGSRTGALCGILGMTLLRDAGPRSADRKLAAYSL
jgi:hypothetical protein